MIYRSWTAMEQYPEGRRILNRFISEFELIKSGQQGTPEQQQAAAEFVASFVPIAAGTFKLGRPKDKPVSADETDLQRGRQFAAGKSVEELVRWLMGRCPTERNAKLEWDEQRLDLYRMLSSVPEDIARDVFAQAFAGAAITDREVLADRDQQVGAFALCRDPMLNRWYRLFDPQHGLRASWYREDYAKYSPDPDTPVIYVSWYDAWVFCRWARWDGQSCHLPGERQWEYAAKAGADDQRYWWGDEFDPTKCNADGKQGRTTAPDDGHCNGWGLRDMLGNVFEWCQDWYGEYSAELPEGPAWGSNRVYRGGSWYGGPLHCRSAYRNWSSPEGRLSDLGFRPARSPVG
jgi:hypothetical protein